MMQHGMSAGSITIVPNSIPASAPPAVTAGTASTSDGLSRHVLLAAVVVLLLPVMILVSVFVLLVPCFFRVPVCGPVFHPTRGSQPGRRL
jgi:hypothetical protein